MCDEGSHSPAGQRIAETSRANPWVTSIWVSYRDSNQDGPLSPRRELPASEPRAEAPGQ